MFAILIELNLPSFDTIVYNHRQSLDVQRILALAVLTQLFSYLFQRNVFFSFFALYATIIIIVIIIFFCSIDLCGLK